MAFSAKNIKVALETAYSKTHIIVMLLVACLFIWIGVYVYRNYVGSYLGSHIEGYAANMGDNAPDPSGKTATLYMFGTGWCPHCKTAKPIWDAYTEKNQNMKVGNYNVLFKSVDCDSAEGKPLADAFGVKGYPSFKLERSPGDVIEFEAKPSEDNFNSLLQSSLQ